jgi:pimeloyl-ACP methyl ester carboxylesterase
MTNGTDPHPADATVLATGAISSRTAGSGALALVLHHEIGSLGWTPFCEALSATFTVSCTDLPGFGGSSRLDWARHPRDLATVLTLYLDKLGVESLVLVGLGFGGWVAAEMAVMNQRRLERLVLVGAMGLQPAEGEIMDQMLMSFDDYIKSGFSSVDAHATVFGSESTREQRAMWGAAREATARIAWKPYMFSQHLPELLPCVETPTLVVWGDDDFIVPLNCGELYAHTLPNARLEVIDGCGHFVDLEKPHELSGRIEAFAGVAITSRV